MTPADHESNGAFVEFGYLFAHFREDPTGFAERIHFSLSVADSLLEWMPLWNGEPVLTSSIGTTGVRDPAIVRDDDGKFHILATDLRVFGGDDRGWDAWRRHGSRSLIVWDSTDLLTWDGPRAVEVAPTTAGMAWAPEVTRDDETGDYIVFWSSTIFAQADIDHTGESYSRILFSRTRDFRNFSSAEVMIDAARDIIDTAIGRDDGRVYRISKHEDRGDESLGVYQEVGSGLFADDFRVIATNIGEPTAANLEAPILQPDPHGHGWFLFLDRYGAEQGYTVLQTADIGAPHWTRVPQGTVQLASNTKHGGILRLRRDEWLRLSYHAELHSPAPGESLDSSRPVRSEPIKESANPLGQ